MIMRTEKDWLVKGRKGLAAALGISVKNVYSLIESGIIDDAMSVISERCVIFDVNRVLELTKKKK